MQQTHPHMTDQTRVCHEPIENPETVHTTNSLWSNGSRGIQLGTVMMSTASYPAFLYQPSQMASKLPLSSNWYPWQQSTIMSDDTVVCLITLGINNFLTSVKLEALSSQRLWSWGSSWIKPAKSCNPFQDAALPQLLVVWYCVCLQICMRVFPKSDLRKDMEEQKNRWEIQYNKNFRGTVIGILLATCFVPSPDLWGTVLTL